MSISGRRVKIAEACLQNCNKKTISIAESCVHRTANVHTDVRIFTAWNLGSNWCAILTCLQCAQLGEYRIEQNRFYYGTLGIKDSRSCVLRLSRIGRRVLRKIYLWYIIIMIIAENWTSVYCLRIHLAARKYLSSRGPSIPQDRNAFCLCWRNTR